MLKREYKRREPTNQERIFLKSRGLIPDSWLIIYENKSELARRKDKTRKIVGIISSFRSRKGGIST